MNELVCGVGMVELGFCQEISSEFNFFNNEDYRMAAKLLLISEHPCVNPLRCLK